MGIPKRLVIQQLTIIAKRGVPIRLSLLLSSIAQEYMNKIILWISVGVDDWAAERAIIASNVCLGPGSSLTKRFALLSLI